MIEWSQLVAQFHWLRPYWLLALLPALLVPLLLWRQTHRARQWGQLVAPELLRHLVDPASRRKRRSYLWGLLLAWIIATLALAGPSWEKRPLPVHKNENALVIVLDLSPSMLAEDLTPSRLARARLKIADILRLREDGFTGLVAYAGDAHVVSPLTDDNATINSLLTALHPNIMPQAGSNTEAAIAQAQKLMEDAGMSEGRILLLTDGVASAAEPTILDRLRETRFRLSILGIGTSEGAPIPNERGGFERDRSGNIVVARLEEDRLERLAGRTGGRYTRIGDRNDIEWLLNQPTLGEERHRELEREFDTWYDRGHWLALLLLPLVLYSFRRGLLVLMLALPMTGLLFSLYPAPAQAADWRAPWLTPNQRGERRLQDGEPEAAAEVFEDPEWLGSALYRAEQYEAAAEAFARSNSARAHYNRGNALARAGDLESALEAYDQALSQAPDMEDARANKALVEQLKEQQEQEQQNQDSDQDDSGEDNGQDQEGSDSEQNDSEQSDGEQKGDSQRDDSGENDAADDQKSQGETPSDPDEEQEPSESPKPEEDPSDPSDESGESKEEGAGEEEGEPETEETPAPATLEDSDLSDEERQSMEQWLRRIPDDPGGLLRRKFEYQSQQRRLERYRGETPTEVPDAEERW